jgi:hypothetical protein
MLQFLRDAECISVNFDPEASNAVTAACRKILDERTTVEFVEAIEARSAAMAKP